jgi:hypothetical protein
LPCTTQKEIEWVAVKISFESDAEIGLKDVTFMDVVDASVYGFAVLLGVWDGSKALKSIRVGCYRRRRQSSTKQLEPSLD